MGDLNESGAGTPGDSASTEVTVNTLAEQINQGEKNSNDDSGLNQLPAARVSTVEEKPVDSAKKGAKGRTGKNAKPVVVVGAAGDALTLAGKNVSSSKSSAQSTAGLAVTSNQDGFWRGDLRWSSSPIVVRLCDLSDHQIEQIRGEPMLSVVEVDVPLDQDEN